MIKFEEKIECINSLIQKNRGKWHLSDIGGFGFDDVAQTIRLHIYNKWPLWDQSRPFEHWCNKLIIHQIKNIVRNRYSRDAPPCSSCPFDRGGELCGYTDSGLKCEECPQFKKWSKKKQSKFFLKTAISIDQETFKEAQDFSDPISSMKLESSVCKFHIFIKQFLNPKMANFYHLMYVENLSDDEVIEEIKSLNGKGITKRQLTTIRKKLQIIAKSKIPEFDPEYEYN
jgi:hypothetical protein